MNVAVMKTKAEQALTEAFAAVAPKLPGTDPVKAARNEAIGRFSALGLPHRRIEEWKYTDLRANLKDVLPLAVEDDTAVTIADLVVALGPLAHIEAHRITFVNGRYRAELSERDAVSGLDVKPLAEVLATSPAKVVDGLMQADGEGGDATLALNTAFMTDGAIVRVADDTTIDKPLLVVFVKAGAEPRFSAVRNVIALGKNTAATIIEVHVAVPGAAKDGQVNALTQLTVGDGASLVHAKVAVDDGKGIHLATWNAALGTDATYNGFQFTMGPALARNQINVLYNGQGTKLDLSGAYLARGHEHVDTTLVVDHAVPHCESRELFKGVLDDHGRGVFQGKIIVRPDAQKTDGKQMAQVLMLSPDAEFDSKPELEIFADDVVCGHGTTSAELDDDLLFYCRSRGIPANEARALLIESFIGEAIDKVEHEGLHDALMSYARAWLGAPAHD